MIPRNFKPIMYLAGYTGTGEMITIDWRGTVPEEDVWVISVMRDGDIFIWTPPNQWWKMTGLQWEEIVILSRPFRQCVEAVEKLTRVTDGHLVIWS